MRVGYLGPAGTYSEEALRASAPPGVEQVPYPTIYDTVMAVHDREIDRAVVPIENALEGAVSVTLDTLALDATDVRIVAEVVHQIHHCVVAAWEVELAEVKRVFSHPQPTAQCRRFLRERLAGAELIVAASTSDPASWSSARGSVPAQPMAAASSKATRLVLATMEVPTHRPARFRAGSPAGGHGHESLARHSALCPSGLKQVS